MQGPTQELKGLQILDTATGRERPMTAEEATGVVNLLEGASFSNDLAQGIEGFEQGRVVNGQVERKSE